DWEWVGLEMCGASSGPTRRSNQPSVAKGGGAISLHLQLIERRITKAGLLCNAQYIVGQKTMPALSAHNKQKAHGLLPEHLLQWLDERRNLPLVIHISSI
ncbi:MAG: hypothetical protein ACKVGZ_07965, partial [Alphaproteobacteria bacterium]